MTKYFSPQVCSSDRESLLQLIICEKLEDAALFLLKNISANNVNINHMNEYGETALHLAAMFGLYRLVIALLNNGANVNIETVLPTNKASESGQEYTG